MLPTVAVDSQAAVFTIHSLCKSGPPEAHELGWRVKAHCLQFGPMAKSGHRRRTNVCRTVVELDMQTLIRTRGERFPLDMLESGDASNENALPALTVLCLQGPPAGQPGSIEVSTR